MNNYLFIVEIAFYIICPYLSIISMYRMSLNIIAVHESMMHSIDVIYLHGYGSKNAVGNCFCQSHRCISLV